MLTLLVVHRPSVLPALPLLLPMIVLVMGMWHVITSMGKPSAQWSIGTSRCGISGDGHGGKPLPRYPQAPYPPLLPMLTQIQIPNYTCLIHHIPFQTPFPDTPTQPTQGLPTPPCKDITTECMHYANTKMRTPRPQPSTRKHTHIVFLLARANTLDAKKVDHAKRIPRAGCNKGGPSTRLCSKSFHTLNPSSTRNRCSSRNAMRTSIHTTDKIVAHKPRLPGDCNTLLLCQGCKRCPMPPQPTITIVTRATPTNKCIQTTMCDVNTLGNKYSPTHPNDAHATANIHHM